MENCAFECLESHAHGSAPNWQKNHPSLRTIPGDFLELLVGISSRRPRGTAHTWHGAEDGTNLSESCQRPVGSSAIRKEATSAAPRI